MRERETEKKSWDRLKVKTVIMVLKGKENLGFVVLVEEESWHMKIRKKRKIRVEEIDCHIRNPKKRFFTTIDGGGGEAVGMDFFFLFFLEGLDVSDKWVLGFCI